MSSGSTLPSLTVPRVDALRAAANLRFVGSVGLVGDFWWCRRRARHGLSGRVGPGVSAAVPAVGDVPQARTARPFPDLAVPAWVSLCGDDGLRATAGSGSFTRGAQYARAGAVLSLSTDADGALVGEVRGSGRRRYVAVVRPTTAARSGPAGWSGSCSCPVSVDCKHAVAIVLTARRPVSPAPAPPPPPEWERRLAVFADADAPGRGVPLGLQIELVEPVRTGSARRRLGLRPVRAGVSGRWVRTGASWRDLQYGGAPTRAAHREAVLALQHAWQARRPSWYAVSDTAVHLDELGWSALRLLAAAWDAGVVLLDAAGRPEVRLADEPARVRVDLRREAGSVVLQPSVVLPGAHGAPMTLVGTPAVGAFACTRGLVLAGFDTPLDIAIEALLSDRPVEVPEADLPRLARRYLPVLGRRAELVSSDDSVALTPVEPPQLALDVHYEPDHVATLSWSFLYAFGNEQVEVPLGEAGDAEVARDPTAELALLDGLVGLPDVPSVWVGGAAGTGPRPSPSARLTGLPTALLTTELLPALRSSDVVVTVSGEPADYCFAAAPPLVEVSVRDDAHGDPDWFDLGVSVSVAGETVPLAMLLTALAGGQSHLVLLSGTVVRLDQPELTSLRSLLEEARALVDVERGTVRVTPLQAGLWEELVALGVVREQSERWSRTVRGLLDLTKAPPAEPPLKMQADLRPYQQEGYRWLAQLWDLRLGGVLADDMGLGKTVQVLALAARAHEAGQLDAPLLVVAPTSVVGAWCEQAERFVPDLSVVAISETSRRCGRSVAARVAGAAVVVTSYALLRLDEEHWLDLPWSALVLDEAQHVKNPAAKAYAVARRLPAPVKLAVTGTPLENSLLDLWSLFSLVAPGLFPDREHFDEHYRRPIEAGDAPERLATMRRRIRPLMLRRTKEQVAVDLPPKVEQVVEVALTPQHRRLYDRYLQRERQRVLGLLDDVQRNRFAIFRSLTLLRQLSLDPALVDPDLPTVAAAKIDVLAGMLEELGREGHRALVFSSFTGFLSRVRSRLDADGVGYCYLDGRTRDRPRRIEQWRSGDDPVFLISLKAGGTGLTLTEADYVFVLDPWWNPAVEAQAVDRAHRIGQSRTVMVYRLVSDGTIEQKVLALQQRKRDLFDAVVAGDGNATGSLTAEDVRALLG
jgi:superfamily II DNA or RNA helicase